MPPAHIRRRRRVAESVGAAVVAAAVVVLLGLAADVAATARQVGPGDAAPPVGGSSLTGVAPALEQVSATLGG